jgi:hypothetical protein
MQVATPRATIIALLVMAASVTVAHAQRVRRDLDLVNHSLVTVASFFASNAGTDRWDVDLLGRRGLLTNHFVQLDSNASPSVPKPSIA